MSSQKEYVVCFSVITPPEDLVPNEQSIITTMYYSEPFVLPTWFIHATPNYKKLIRIQGATGAIMQSEELEDTELPKGLRLMSNLTKDFPLNGFVMMINNYMNMKEFDVSYLNIREIVWGLQNVYGNPFPFQQGIKVDLVVELELLIVPR